MKTFLLVSLTFLVAFHLEGPAVDKTEAKEAFQLLNQVRTKPEQFYKELPFLKDYTRRPALKWNDTLAKVAEQKALDMATNNYFGHIDKKGFGMNHHIQKAGYQLKPAWIKNPTENYFESLNAGTPSGKEVIKSLLIDEGIPSLGHRWHLLGIDPFYKACTILGSVL